MARQTSTDPAAARLLTGFSLEMTGKDVESLREARSLLPAGTRVNVTFLGNEDLDMRVAAVRAVQEAGLVPVAHLSARRLASVAALEEYLARLEDIGASEHVFVVGGDPAEPEGPYADSLSVIRSGLLARHGVREVGIAGYPEGHPDIAHDVLWRALTDKTAELADQGLDATVITQFAFDTEPVLAWILRARELGVAAPVRVGTPGPAGVKRLLAFARRFGVGANATIVRKYGFTLTNLLATAGPDAFVADLARAVDAAPAPGIVRIHLYTFGGVAATAAWAAGQVVGGDAA
jgi:methylenetetrahydrofolate reductase (NADPH)